ncbi:MAG: insulinase family protein, partial [Pseudomonadales bacterium]
MLSNVTSLLRVLVFVACSCILGLAQAGSNVVSSAAVIKSDNDARDYEWLTLDNGLQALLVSDIKATKAAAALDVNVGAKADPQDRQGLAHFLEHMLFLGTKKYPESGEYQEFISSHGGSHNAYTSFEHTNYFFDVNASYLRETLDRFAQFFVAPLFTARYVEREMNAVESEYRSRLRDDSRRSLDVFQQIINPEHPFNKLSVGNLQTLNGGGTDAARAELLKFYQRHYSADNMRLVVIGREPVAELRTWVKDLFSSVPRRKTHAETSEPALFEAGSLPKMVSIKPEKDTRNLSVTFPIPTTQEHYKSKPVQYIGNIIGHEGKGSLLSYLKQQDWAEQLSAGAGFEDASGATFNVVISLTDAGLKQQNEVLKLLFQTIARIKREGIQDWLFKEQSELLTTRFRFQEKSQPINYASGLANSMHYYPATDVLRAGYLMEDYKPELIADFLDYLKPDNALITLMAAGENFPQRSPWYDTPYAVTAVDVAQLRAWSEAEVNAAILVPEPNPFVPHNFAMPRIKKPATVPVELQLGERTRMWWLQDNKFKVPKTQAYFNFHTPLANDTPLNAALSQLYVDLLQDSLNEFAYPAVLAGLQVSALKHLRGVSIKVGGYSDKQRLLLKRVAKVMAMEEVDPQRFVALKKERIRSWLNAKKQLPYLQVIGAVSETLIKSYWQEDELVHALREASIDDLQSFKTRFFQTANVDAMIYGNLKKGQAKR